MLPKRTIFYDLREDDRFVARFWRKVSIGAPEACWEWTAYRGKGVGHNYGKLGIDGRIHYAHRIAWELTHGPIPDDLRVLHSCDNPPCCNPAHLSLGTQAKNVQEIWDRNKTRKRAKPPVGHKCRGEAHHSARFTEPDIIEIRRLAAEGVPQKEIAAQRGVSGATISAIVLRKKWKHVS